VSSNLHEAFPANLMSLGGALCMSGKREEHRRRQEVAVPMYIQKKKRKRWKCGGRGELRAKKERDVLGSGKGEKEKTCVFSIHQCLLQGGGHNRFLGVWRKANQTSHCKRRGVRDVEKKGEGDPG